jgi:hypothetical protein
MNGYLGRRLGAKQPENINEITPKLIQKIVGNLNLIEKLTLRIRGFLFIDNIKFEGWSKELPLYLFKCDLHGYELNYPQGHYMKLICLDCIRKQLEEMPDATKMIYKKYIKRNKEEDEDNAAMPTNAVHS